MSSKFRRGNQALSVLKSRLREMPVKLAEKVAAQVAPDLTGAAVTAYDEGRTVYGESRPKGKNGQALDLVESGATKRTVRFKNDGRLVRAVLTTRWAKYLIGKYGILPNGAPPVDWKRQIDHRVRTAKVDLK